MRRWLPLMLAVLSVLTLETTAVASSAIVVKISTPDVAGSSTIPGHVGEIILSSFSFTNAQSQTPDCGTARLIKDVDSASPTLFLNQLSAKFYQTVRVAFLDATAARNPEAILTVTLTTVFVTEYALNETATVGKGAPAPTETLVVSFSTMRMTNEVTGETKGWDCKNAVPL